MKCSQRRLFGFSLHSLLPLLTVSFILFAPPLIAKSLKQVTLCGHPTYPPISWLEADQIKGVAPYSVEKIFTHLGYDVVRYQTFNWKRCLHEAKEGHVDIVVSAFRIKAREDYLAFSREPIIEEPIVPFYNPKFPIEFESWHQLKGKRIGMLLGDTFGAEADQKIEKYMQIERVSSGKQNFGKLATGRIEVLPLGLYGGSLQALKLGYYNQINYLDRPLVIDSWYVAISKKSPLVKHMPELNQALKKMKDSGEIETLMQQFSHEYTQRSVSCPGESASMSSPLSCIQNKLATPIK